MGGNNSGIRKATRYFRTHRAPSPGSGMRIVIAGKGGVGKTTTCAILASIFAGAGMNVLAVDEDPQQNLAFSLGYPPEFASEIVPLAQNAAYIEEKVGVRPGGAWGGVLRLNPQVADVVERFGIAIDDRISLLVMGSVLNAAGGCLCPENALLGSVIRYIRLRRDEVILMDTQAGVEHFGRAMSDGFSQAVVVTEPSFNAYTVAEHSAFLARDLGIRHVHLVINKVRSEADICKIERFSGGGVQFTSVHYLPYNEEIIESEPDVLHIGEMSVENPVVDSLRELYHDICAVAGQT
ncbi:carbon monoxide dehydrogenase [Methanomicrobiaceae archaeon CYW5]|uniref:ATP-binding protein n=1 Tax=Methanovulcanius yangii TaxID=1789227 RepID=UPI0029CA21D7|nr:AAA family ATPase [Methanovulcanius yangii]MBT8506869.1 carbon monoxide dehydrogenase [Methanovulcanius yangii]